MPQRARSAQALQQRPRRAGQGLSFLLFKAEAGREAAREQLCGLPPSPPCPPRTSRLVGSPPSRRPPAALQTPQTHPGRACRACARLPLPTNVLRPPSSPRSDLQHSGQMLPPPLCGSPATPFLPPSQHQPFHVPLATPSVPADRAGGRGVGECSLRPQPRLSHLVLPVLGEKGLQRALGRGAMERSSMRIVRLPHAPKLGLPSLPLSTPPQPSLQGTSHTDSGLRLQNCSGLSPGFSPREEPALAASFHLPARPLWEPTKLTPPEPRLPTGAVKARSAKKTLPDQSWGLSRHQHSRHDRISGTLSPYCRLWSQHAASKQPPRFCKKKKKSET